MTLHRESETKESLEALLEAYLGLQVTHIGLSRPDLSELVREEVESLVKSDTQYKSKYLDHLQHLAYAYVQHDFAQFAIDTWMRLLGAWKGRELQRALAGELVEYSPGFSTARKQWQTRVGLAHLNLHLGKPGYQEYLSPSSNPFNWCSISKFFSTTASLFLLTPKEGGGGVQGQFLLGIRFYDPSVIDPESLLRLVVERDGEIVEETEFVPIGTLLAFQLRGKPLYSLVPSHYTLVAELKDELTGEVYQHRQVLDRSRTLEESNILQQGTEVIAL